MENRRDLTVLIVDEHSDISSLLAWRLSMVRGIRVIGETANVMIGASSLINWSRTSFLPTSAARDRLALKRTDG